jgi:hypothetical protein
MISKVYFNVVFFFVLFQLLQSKSCQALAGISVGRRARLEASVKNVKKYRNPYSDLDKRSEHIRHALCGNDT